MCATELAPGLGDEGRSLMGDAATMLPVTGWRGAWGYATSIRALGVRLRPGDGDDGGAGAQVTKSCGNEHWFLGS